MKSSQSTESSPRTTSIHFADNPSRWSIRIVVMVLGSVACVISVYLALFQWGIVSHVWDPIFGEQSEQVLTSKTSQQMHAWLGFPDAALGAIGYLSEVVLALVGSTHRWRARTWLTFLFGVDVIAIGIVSTILVILQGTVVGAWCAPCILTALISLGLIFFAFPELRASWMYLHHVWQTTQSKNMVWKSFLGQQSEHAGDDATDASSLVTSEKSRIGFHDNK